MAVFVCAECGTGLTASVSEVALPVHAHQKYGHQFLPALMDPGTYAVDPEPFGPPWRRWSGIAAEEAAERGVFAPALAGLSFGAPGAVVLAPGDVRGAVLIPERCDGHCMGPDGRDGPNLACVECGRAVGTRIDDCSYWQAVRLAPDAVRRVPGPGAAPRPAGWRTLARERPGLPPVQSPGEWSPRWAAAAGVVLAHLLAASGGARVAVPGGLFADTVGRALDAMLPPGPHVKRAVLSGPGLPSPAVAHDIALVPLHPQTGRTWRPATRAAHTVPVDFDVWTHLAFPYEALPVPATGGLPVDVLRDDPLPMHPRGPFRPDGEVFLHTLARLPAVRRPWLRAVFDRVNARPYAAPF